MQKLMVNQIHPINKWTHASNVPFLSSFRFSSHGANVDGRGRTLVTLTLAMKVLTD